MRSTPAGSWAVGGEEAPTQFLDRQVQQQGRIGPQVQADQPVAVGRVGGDRHDRGDAAQGGRETGGGVEQGLALLQHVPRQALVAECQGVVIESGLGATHQPGQRDGGLDVGQGIVGARMGNAVGGGQGLEAEGGGAVLARWPLDPRRPQGMGEAQGVDQVPAGVAVLPLTGIGVQQVAEEEVAGDLVVEADAVVAGPAGAGGAEYIDNGGGEFGLDQALRRS